MGIIISALFRHFYCIYFMYPYTPVTNVQQMAHISCDIWICRHNIHVGLTQSPWFSIPVKTEISLDQRWHPGLSHLNTHENLVWLPDIDP